MNIHSLAIHNSYWVIEGRLRAGEHPGNGPIADIGNKLKWLNGLGINTIVDLTENEMVGIDYSSLITKVAKDCNTQVNYINTPIHDFSTPSNEEMIKILDIVDQELLEHKNIYLHCYGGMGRTGLTVGCYLARHGIAGIHALEKIRELRSNLPEDHKQSPETDGQIRMVLEWNINQ